MFGLWRHVAAFGGADICRPISKLDAGESPSDLADVDMSAHSKGT
jgi:hypothetical protein